jgi:hypothetical protein
VSLTLTSKTNMRERKKAGEEDVRKVTGRSQAVAVTHALFF